MNSIELKNLSETNLRSDEFTVEYSNYISYDSETQILKLMNLKLNSQDRNRQLLQQVLNKFSPNNHDLRTVLFDHVEFEAGNLNIGAQKIRFENCTISGDGGSYWHTSEVEFVDCDIPNYNFDLEMERLLIERSNLGTLSIYSYSNDNEARGDVRIKSINVKGGSTIQKMDGLHKLLENESGTVVVFSQDSKILNNADESYRIMRLISNKFGDVVQSQTFHINTVELHSKHANKETKFLLFLEKWTNDFGRSIFLPLLWMVVTNFVSVVILMTFSGQFLIENFWDFIGTVLNVSPLSSFVPDDVGNTTWEFSLDSVRRIFLAVLTYQIIVSARRFSFTKR